MTQRKIRKLPNNCAHYHHEKGLPKPGPSDSCRGCIYNMVPSLYDGGCTRTDRNFPVTNPLRKGISA